MMTPINQVSLRTYFTSEIGQNFIYNAELWAGNLVGGTNTK